MYEVDIKLEKWKSLGYIIDEDTAKLLRTIEKGNYIKGIKAVIKRAKKRNKEIDFVTIFKNMLRHGVKADEVVRLLNIDEILVKRLTKK